ncbi:serine/threonine-protein kinase [Streptomyces sp. NPDC006326]|uniref:serine/threonine-protein kinase n=1 Tax=Streptomyces sp. NPDC006326 TaxID=3156752 RepID=UPI0033ADC08E
MERPGPSDPARVGPFRTVGVLGQGGMGRVLLGAGPDGRLVAVKQVHEQLAHDDGFRARFRREVEASRRVSGAYTAAVIDADADARTPWLASVFVAGPSLGAAVESVGVLSEELLRRLAAGLASALAEIHGKGLVHRDLKPDNVLLAEDGVRVVDFGIARAVEGRGSTGLTRAGWVVGSPAYMSPEQAESRELTRASDVFSLGSVLFMAATGRSPFAGTSTLQTLYDVAHAEPDLRAVPAGLRPLVRRCLAKDPVARPTPAQLLDLLGPVAPAGRPWPPGVYAMITAQRRDIDRLLGVEAPEPEPAPEPAPRREPEPLRPRPPTARPSWRRAGWAAAAVVVAGLAGVAAAVWPDGGGGSPSAKGPASGSASPSASASFYGYSVLRGCGEMAWELPPGRTVDEDRHEKTAYDARTVCTWRASDPSAPPSEVVQWDLLLSGWGLQNAAEEQQRRFGAAASGKRREAGLGAGDEAYWADGGSSTVCALAVRDHNLSLTVTVTAERHPGASCEQDAKNLARTALAAARPG